MTYIHVYLQNLVMVLWCLTYVCHVSLSFWKLSVKIKAEYKEAKAMFQEKQGCSNPWSWSDLAKEHVQVQDEYDHSIPRSNYAVDEPQGKYGLTISKLTPGIFSEGLNELLKECSPSVNIHRWGMLCSWGASAHWCINNLSIYPSSYLPMDSNILKFKNNPGQS